MIILAKALAAAGYEGTTVAFRELVAATFAEQYPGWTDEQLERRPRDALHFCNVIRLLAKTPDLPDEVILGALTNMRKRPSE